MASPLTPATATRSPYAYRPGDRRSGTPLPWPAPTRALPPTPTPYRRRTHSAHRVQLPPRVALSDLQARDPRTPAAGRRCPRTDPPPRCLGRAFGEERGGRLFGVSGGRLP